MRDIEPEKNAELKVAELKATQLKAAELMASNPELKATGKKALTNKQHDLKNTSSCSNRIQSINC